MTSGRGSVRKKPARHETPEEEIARLHPEDSFARRWGLEKVVERVSDEGKTEEVVEHDLHGAVFCVNARKVQDEDRDFLRRQARNAHVIPEHLDAVVDRLQRNFVRDADGWRRPGTTKYIDTYDFEAEAVRVIEQYEAELGESTDQKHQPPATTENVDPGAVARAIFGSSVGKRPEPPRPSNGVAAVASETEQARGRPREVSLLEGVMNEILGR